jgi:hypothetical protein
MMNVEFVVVMIVYVPIVLVYQTVITLKIIVELVILTAQMTVYRIVPELGVDHLKMMNVEFVVVTILPVQMIVAYPMVITAHVLMNAAYPMVTTHLVLTVLECPMAQLM